MRIKTRTLGRILVGYFRYIEASTSLAVRACSDTLPAIHHRAEKRCGMRFASLRLLFLRAIDRR